MSDMRLKLSRFGNDIERSAVASGPVVIGHRENRACHFSWFLISACLGAHQAPTEADDACQKKPSEFVSQQPVYLPTVVKSAYENRGRSKSRSSVPLMALLKPLSYALADFEGESSAGGKPVRHCADAEGPQC
jgi:hypothetical protein